MILLNPYQKTSWFHHWTLVFLFFSIVTIECCGEQFWFTFLDLMLLKVAKSQEVFSILFHLHTKWTKLLFTNWYYWNKIVDVHHFFFLLFFFWRWDESKNIFWNFTTFEGSFDSSRLYDPIVFKGIDLPELLGTEIDSIVGFVYQPNSSPLISDGHAWVQIPIQIDEKHWQDWTVIKNGGDCRYVTFFSYI